MICTLFNNPTKVSSFYTIMERVENCLPFPSEAYLVQPRPRAFPLTDEVVSSCISSITVMTSY